MEKSERRVLNANLLLNRYKFKYEYSRVLYNAICDKIHSYSNIPVDISCIREIFESDVANYLNEKFNSECNEADLITIKYLILDDAEIMNIDFAKKCANLEILDCNGDNYIDSLRPLITINKLKKLSFNTKEYGGNSISDLRSLSHFEDLKSLSLINNKVYDIEPISNLFCLEYLNLNGNNITRIFKLQNLVNLRELHVQHNPIEIDDLILLRKTLPNCKIYHTYYFEDTGHNDVGEIMLLDINDVKITCWVGIDRVVDGYNEPEKDAVATIDVIILDAQLYNSITLMKEQKLESMSLFIEEFAAKSDKVNFFAKVKNYNEISDNNIKFNLVVKID